MKTTMVNEYDKGNRERCIANITFDKEDLEKIVSEMFENNDFVQVVRCKDCKWYDSERHDCPYMEEVLDDDYCSYGELKEQEDGKDTDSDSDM